MNRTILYGILGAVTFLVFLITSIPASQGHQWIHETLTKAQISITQLSGTIWSGSARRIQFKSMHLENIGWEIHPLALLIGKLKLSIEVNDPEIKGSATLSFDRQGLTYLENLDGKFPAHLLTQLPYTSDALSIATLTGSFALDIETIHFSDKQLPIQTKGQITWHDAGISSPLSLPLGTVLLKLETPDEDTHIYISNKAGPVKIDATLIISNDGNYRINGTLLPLPDINQELISTLSLLGKKDTQGKIHVNFMGIL